MPLSAAETSFSLLTLPFCRAYRQEQGANGAPTWNDSRKSGGCQASEIFAPA